jgi:hypothetical protein
VSRTDRPATDDVGFLLAKASAHYNELLLARFTAAGFPEIRGSFGSVLIPLFEQDARRVGELARVARLSKQRLTARGRRFQTVAEQVLAELDRKLRDALGSRNRDALVKALKGVMEL